MRRAERDGGVTLFFLPVFSPSTLPHKDNRSYTASPCSRRARRARARGAEEDEDARAITQALHDGSPALIIALFFSTLQFCSDGGRSEKNVLQQMLPIVGNASKVVLHTFLTRLPTLSPPPPSVSKISLPPPHQGALSASVYLAGGEIVIQVRTSTTRGFVESCDETDVHLHLHTSTRCRQR